MQHVPGQFMRWKDRTMDQIALISDIHGNIPALEATLHDIRRRHIQRIFCLGDLVGKGPHSDQAVPLPSTPTIGTMFACLTNSSVR